MALRSKPFTTYPRSIGSTTTAFVFRPRITSLSPGKAKFTQTRSVQIEATLTDGTSGTGINASACRLYVDGINKTNPATVTRYGLRLRLSSLTNGSHTYKVRCGRPRGKRQRPSQRTFTVNVAVVPSATPTTTWPTYVPTTPVLPTTSPYIPHSDATPRRLRCHR